LPDFLSPPFASLPTCRASGSLSPVQSGRKTGERGDLMTPFEKNQLKVAEDTLRMPGAMLGVMGGVSKEEAKEIIRKLKAKDSTRRLS